MSESSDDSYIVKLRGLPWSATVEDIQDFFRDCKIVGGKDGIHMTSSREGRPSGEAFVELENSHDLEVALQKDRDHIGSRYIEVFKVNRAEMEWMIKRSGSHQGISDDGCVRLRGLPFGCSKEEIAQFFTGLEIVPNGITLLTDYAGRSTGEAYVEFVNREVAEKALQKHREKIGHRYIEIFRSSLLEVQSVVGYQGKRAGGGGPSMSGSGMFGPRPGPYDRDNRFSRTFQPRGARNFKGSNFSNNGDYYDRPMMWSGRGEMGHRNRNFNMDPWIPERKSNNSIHMRGLPFKAREDDIADFFKPIIPIDIHLIHDQSGRASGEADVEFASHDDAVRAMGKDKSNMLHRYIELFLNGSSNGGGGGSGSGGSGSGGGSYGGPSGGGRRPYY